jgi:hypothetical protein
VWRLSAALNNGIDAVAVAVVTAADRCPIARSVGAPSWSTCGAFDLPILILSSALTTVEQQQGVQVY